MVKARAGQPLTDVEIIDAHGHLGPYGGFYVAGADAKGMVEVMDEVGIDAVCISSSPISHLPILPVILAPPRIRTGSPSSLSPIRRL